MPTAINEIIRGVREITLDQFPQPAFLVKKKKDENAAVSLNIGDSAVSLVREDAVSSLSRLILDNQTVAIFFPDRLAYTFYLDANRPGEIDYKLSSPNASAVKTETVHDENYHKEVLITVTSEDENHSTTYTLQIFFRHPEALRSLTLNGASYDLLPMYPEQYIPTPDGIYNLVAESLVAAGLTIVDEDCLQETLNLFFGIAEFFVYVLPTFPDLETVRLSLQASDEEFSFGVVDADSFYVDSFSGTRTYQIERNSCPFVGAILVNGEPIDEFFPEKNRYYYDISTEQSGPLELSAISFLPGDERHTYTARYDYSGPTHYAYLDVLLDGEVLNTYTLTLNYVDPSYAQDWDSSVITSYPYEEYRDLIELGRAMKADTDQPILFDFWPTLTQQDSLMELQRSIISGLSDEDPSVMYRRYFFSDAHYENLIRRYFDQYYRKRFFNTDQIEEILSGLEENMRGHAILWVAFWAVEDRRTYELAAQSLVGGADNFDLESGYSSLYSASSGPGSEVQVQIGSVFTLRENDGSSSASSKKAGGPVAQVGADNILGDENTFWYRLQGFIRKRFEDIYRDYSLRSNEVIEGYDELSPVIEHNFMAYFDSYPYRVSPYARGVFGGNRGISDSAANYSSGSVA